MSLKILKSTKQSNMTLGTFLKSSIFNSEFPTLHVSLNDFWMKEILYFSLDRKMPILRAFLGPGKKITTFQKIQFT